ncbi:MAG: glycosyltransferase family 4 protein [Bacteroidia bacterium]|nr:glycosyltransferase family 4 protein [Bacteroidia bacterium]
MAKNKLRRPTIAFFDYPDVFEDFYPHYGVNQKDFATSWHNTGSHAWLRIIQEKVGMIKWMAFTLKPELNEDRHQYIGGEVIMLKSSFLHRLLWKAFYLPSFAWRWQAHYRAYAGISSYLLPWSFQFFRKLISLKPDAILVQDYCSGKYDICWLLSRVLRIPLLAYHTGSTPEGYLGKSIRKFTLPRADWVFPSADSEMAMLNQRYRISRSKMSIIRPPIDTDIYRSMDREEACRRTGLDPNRRYFIYIGRLNERFKRLGSIIKAFGKITKEYDEIDLLVLGKGQDESDLKYLAKEEAGDRIHFLGWVAGDQDKCHYLNASEVLIMASAREGVPGVIGEAFSCGIPVISSSVGGIGELVLPGKSGWIFEAGDDQSLYLAMKEQAQNPHTARKMSAFVREIAEDKFSIQAVGKALTKGFEEVLSHKNLFPNYLRRK